jgi:uncharacterized membrane protein
MIQELASGAVYTNAGTPPLILVALVPFYWVGAGPLFLLVVQVAAQASGATAVYLLARDRFGTRWPAVTMSAVLLLHPSYQFLAWESFHPETLAIAPLLFAYWAARAKRWRLFTVAVVLALACKEDVALAVVVLGILIYVRGHRRVGILVSSLSALWFLLATRVIIPLSNGIGPFYDAFFTALGSSPGEMAWNALTKPVQTLKLMIQEDRRDYYRMTFAPLAFLPLAALPTLLIAAPMLAINALTSFPYARDIKYHYSALVLVGVILATVEAIARLGTTSSRRAFLVGLVAATPWRPASLGGLRR